MEALLPPLPKHSACYFHPYSHPSNHLIFRMFAVTSVWFEDCLAATMCLCEQRDLIGLKVYVKGLFCWGKGLILSDDRRRPSSWQWQQCLMPAFESVFSSSLSLPSLSYLHPSSPTSSALNYELTARHNYDILASTLKMGEEQCSESLVSILIYQGHSTSVSDLTLSSLCFPLYFVKWR